MSKPTIVAFDIGGTWIRAYLLRGSQVVQTVRLLTPARSRVTFASQLVQIYHRLAHGVRVSAVKVGVAGKVQGKRVVSSRNIPALTSFSFSSLFPRGIPVSVDNDARFFLNSVLVRDPKLKQGVILAVTLGTGIGRAVARNGKVRRLEPLEHSEPWEKAYQRRRFQAAGKLAEFIAKKLAPLMLRYQPWAVVLGGGVVERKRGLYRELHARLVQRYGVRVVLS